MITVRTRCAWLVAMVAFAAVLGGCRSRGQSGRTDYHVQVRNDSGGVIRALVLRHEDERIKPIFETKVYPRDRGEVSLPMRSKGESLVLQVDAPNNPGAPARLPLAPGQTIVSVTRQGGEGPINLELIRDR